MIFKNNILWLYSLLTLSLFCGCSGNELNDESGNDEKKIEIFLSPENDKEFDNGSFVVFPELNQQVIDNLELLCKIWGFLKYHHPAVGKGSYNWDYELFRILPKYLQALSTDERDKTLTDWINKYGIIPACKTCKETPSDAYIKPNLLWAENSNMNSALKAKIRENYQNRHQGEHYYINTQKVSNPEFLNESPKITYHLIYPDAGYRLLTLYIYWNMIHYFFPNKYLTDKNWDDLLPEYLPLFILAKNRLEFELAALQLIGEINDSYYIQKVN